MHELRARLWEPVIREIRNNSRFLLCTHRDPDADGVGAQLALRHALVKLGKQVTVLNPDTLPETLHFLDRERAVLGYDSLDEVESERLLDQAQTIFFLDAGLWKRLGKMGPAVERRSGKVLMIDHHPPEGSAPAGSVIDESASSSGELVFELLENLGLPLDDEIAFCLYAAIVKDTGSFRFGNTTRRVFEIAGRLTEFDIRPDQVYDYLFERCSKNCTVLLGRVLGTLGFAYDDRLAWIHVTNRMLEETGVPVEETENFINVIRAIDSVRACLFFRETGEGKVRVSFRSKGSDIDINLLAEKFGGGGHRKASGAAIQGEITEVIRQVVEAAGMFFKGSPSQIPSVP